MARSKDSLLRLHARLVTRRDALRKALDGDIESLHALSSLEVGDNVDAAMDTASEEINSQIIEIEVRELDQIERALARIAQGSYGRCEHCDERIGEARVNALPYVSTCIDCAREQERNGYVARKASASDEGRWAKLYDREAAEGDEKVDLSEMELDFSEMNR